MNLVLTKWRNYLSTSVGHLLLQNRPDDRFIAAYPRSGSTWLRTMLVNVMDRDARSNPDVFNAMIPGVSIRNARRVNAVASPRLIMTHGCWTRRVPKALYLVRDGRDAIVSLFHYEVTRRGLGDAIDFAEFFRRYRSGVYGPPWHENVLSWLDRGRQTMGERLLVVRFEDLKADTARWVTEIASFLDIDTAGDRVERAIEDASIARMRKIEAARKARESAPDETFYRGGRSGQWRGAFTPEIEQRFLELSARALGLAGYGP